MTDKKDELPQFYPPKRALKSKVGHGGLSKETISKAQRVIDLNKVDFSEVAKPYMVCLEDSVQKARAGQSDNHEKLIEGVLFPAMQLKANGDLFHYPIITDIANKFLWFLERIYKLNSHALDIVEAFERSINMVFQQKLSGKVTAAGKVILNELDAVCTRYFEKYPENIHPRLLNKKS